jgi:hypothetical protein
MGSGWFGGIYFGQYAQQVGVGSIILIALDGAYEPLITLDGSYEPTQTLDGAYEPTIDLDGSVE